MLSPLRASKGDNYCSQNSSKSDNCKKKATEKRSHESMYKTNTKNEAKILRATTLNIWGVIEQSSTISMCTKDYFQIQKAERKGLLL